jgi:alpha-glucosidase
MLLEGLEPGSVSQGFPQTGFAARDLEIGYEMQFGAFKPADKVKGSWKVSERIVAGTGNNPVNVTVVGPSFSELVKMEITAPETGHLKILVKPGSGSERRFSWGFKCASDDHFMGFGWQAIDVDHRGYTVPSWVQESGIGKVMDDSYDDVTWMLVGRRHASHMPLPQFFSSRGFIMTAESDLRPVFSLCSEVETNARVEVTLPATLHIFDGPSPREAIERATAVFGRPRMPPDFAFAPWLDAIYGSANVRRVAQKLRDRGVPSSVIWTEDWKGAKQDGDKYVLSENWSVDRTLYPDFEQLATDLHSSGFKFFTYFNTFMYESSDAWAETSAKDLLIKNSDGLPYTFTGGKFMPSSLLDFSNPYTREWVQGKLKAAMAMGVDGWMGDFAEWMPTDAVTYEGNGLTQHHPHTVQWQQVQREAIDTMGDGVERLFFARSGWFGTPELVDVFWAGDQRTDFQVDDGLPTILPIGIGLGLVGISTYGHDIAGYQSSTNPPSTKELWFRWAALGAWSPVMRTHHGYQAKANWNWESDEETTGLLARYAKLHISLAPLWKGLAKVANTTGMPIWRGLGLMFPDDLKAWGITDEVMAGDGILIAPVVMAGATSRNVYLPKGSWFEWYGSGAAVEGSREIEVSVAMDAIPVFAKAGTVVPMFPDGVMTLANESAQVPGPKSVGDDRNVKIFLGDSGSFTEAEGLKYSLKQTGAAGTAPDSFEWNGTKLAVCASGNKSSCFEIWGANRTSVYVTGPGTMKISGSGAAIADLTAEGGAAGRKITWDVRW